MAPPQTPPTVAVFNTDLDFVRFIQLLLSSAGYPSVAADDAADADRLRAVLVAHDPPVVLYDLAPPYEAAWQRFQALRTAAPAGSRQYILTAADRHAQAVIEAAADLTVLCLPFELDELLGVLQAATNRLRA